MASPTSFGSTTSTLTLAGGGGGALGLSLGRGGGENERERRYTSTGLSLVAALASFVPLPGVVAPPAAETHSEEVQGHKSGVGVFEMDVLHPHPYPHGSPLSDHHHVAVLLSCVRRTRLRRGHRVLRRCVVFVFVLILRFLPLLPQGRPGHMSDERQWK